MCCCRWLDEATWRLCWCDVARTRLISITEESGWAWQTGNQSRTMVLRFVCLRELRQMTESMVDL